MPGSSEPTLRALSIFDVAKAKEFCLDFLGFRTLWEHRVADGAPVLQIARGALVVHRSEHHGDGCPGATVHAGATRRPAGGDTAVSELWPWLALAGLGAFHGINPAMGWLFAVALGLHRQSRAVVLEALLPIALGHALAILLVALAVVLLGVVVDQRAIRIGAGALLIGWAAYHTLYGSRHRVRFGMQVGMLGLGAWSFLMATAHGAGLMLVPVLIPLCLAASPARELSAAGSVPIALAAVGVHTLAMLATTGIIAVIVYQWFGVAFLRKGWINLDLIWTAALVVTGLILFLV